MMARVKIEEIIDHLESDIKKALKQSVEKILPNVHIDSSALFREFKRSVGRKCNTWESVPDCFIEND